MEITHRGLISALKLGGLTLSFAKTRSCSRLSVFMRGTMFNSDSVCVAVDDIEDAKALKLNSVQ